MADRMPTGKDRVQVRMVPTMNRGRLLRKRSQIFAKHRLVVFPGDGLAGEKIPVEIDRYWM